MVHEEGRVQIIDFGVSGLMETKADRRGTIIGTFNWMAPELLKQAKRDLGDDRQAPDGTKYGIEVSDRDRRSEITAWFSIDADN